MTNDAADWKIGFKYAMIDALVKNSTPVDPNASAYGNAYGWISSHYDEIRQAINTGEIDYTKTTWEEVSWHEFMGTFYEGDTRKVGLDVHVVLKDGATYKLRYTGTVAELINDVVSDL